MNFKEKAIECNYKKYLKELKGNKLFIYSKTSLEVNKEKLDINNLNYCTKELTQNVKDLDKVIEKLPKLDYIVAFGGGTAIDQAKYIGYKLKKEVIVIPTMISTNAYVTDKVALYQRNKKVTLPAKEPDIVLVDKKILKNSSQMNVYGLADVLSIYTALNDWDLAIKYNNEKIAKEYSDAHSLLLETMDFINNHTYEQICNDTYKIYELVGWAGVITNIYGCGKPESGSEHLFAKELERIKRVPHAISVTNGILLMSLLQNKYSEDVHKVILKLRIFDDEHLYGINKSLLKEAFLSVKIREDRYTVVNLKSNNYEKTFNKFWKIKQEAKK